MPYVLFMRKGRIYVYHGTDWSVDTLVEWSIDHYHKATVQGKVPLVASFWDEIRHHWNDEVELKGGALHVLLMMDENRQIWFSAILLVYGLPLLTVYIFYQIMLSAYQTPDDTVERTKQIELSNIQRKKQLQEWVDKHPAMQRRRRKWE